MWQGKDCEQIEQEAPLRQGDVLKRFVGGFPETLWLVITADCDIAQNKLGDSGLACIRLIPLRQYLREEHLRKVLSRYADSHFRDLRERINKRRNQIASDCSPLSDSAIAEWIQVASLEEIASVLQVVDAKELEYLDNALGAQRDAHSCRTAPHDPQRLLSVVARLQKVAPKDWRQFVGGLLSRLQSRQLPDDLFFVSRIPGEDSLGYLATLRGITFVSASSFTDTVPLAKERSVAYVRIARLAPTFKHGLAQQVGTMFSRIGYPLDYEIDRDEIFDLIADELSDELGRP